MFSNPAAIFILVIAATLLSVVVLILIGLRVLDPPAHRHQKSKGDRGMLINKGVSESEMDIWITTPQNKKGLAKPDVVSTVGKNKRKLAIVFGLTMTYMLVEVIGGVLTSTPALLADAKHMLTDAGALGLMLLAIWFAERPVTPDKTYRYYRAEILAVLTNAIVLLFISVYIVYAAWRRLQDPPEVMSWPTFIVATIGLMVNFIGIWLLADASVKSLYIKAAYLQVLSDMVGSLGVIAASVFMLTTRGYLADPLISAGLGLFIISAGISLFILPGIWTLLRQVMRLLMEGALIRNDLNRRGGLQSASRRG